MADLTESDEEEENSKPATVSKAELRKARIGWGAVGAVVVILFYVWMYFSLGVT